jgi:hypothetical protein
MPPSEDPLDPVLERWRLPKPPDAPMAPEVWRRIAASEGRRERPGWSALAGVWFFRTVFAATFAAACVLAILLVGERRRSRLRAEHEAQLVRNYIRLIDPLVGDPGAGADPGSLEWIRADLDLTPGQYARLKEMHDQVNPRLVALASQVAQMRGEFAAFERSRKDTGQVDFLEFARFVEERRSVARQCEESTRALVASAATVMTPRQRARYLELLGPALMDGTGLPE